jgi:hypothetical protein
MYEILLFSGGLYKFELLTEHVEDIGGLIIQEDRLHISRGSSFLTEEIRVMLIVPPNEVSSIKSLADDIKGEIEELELEETLKNNIIYSFKIHDIICKNNDWLNKESIIKFMEYNEENELMGIDDDKDMKTDILKNLEECLDLMISLELIEKRENEDELEYRIAKDVKTP